MSKVIIITTTTEFWDCNCEKNYFRKKDEVICKICGAKNNDDQPDSRVDELRSAGYKI